jgi:hypothetical protein
MFLPGSAFTQVRSDASGYGAEYGRAVGGVTGAITKSGTNRFHGDFLYVVQNPSWRSQSEVVPSEHPDRTIGSLETSLGGPIVRDRAWFFAAHGDTNSNRVTSLVGGDLLDGSLRAESTIAKAAFDVSRRQRVAITGIDSSAGSALGTASSAELAAVTAARRGGEFVTAAWDWAAASAKFVEVRAATQRATSNRVPIASVPIRSGASPDDPAGNHGTYWDNSSGLRWQASDLPLGPGTLEFPRDQANVSFTWLVDRHELELGGDHQEIGWEALNRPPDRYLGGGYDPEAPGGFTAPQLKRVFLPIDSPVGTRSTLLAAFAQDRVELGDRWGLTVGLRAEDQEHFDEDGQRVLASTDLAPRAAVVYDAGGDGKILIKATAGRYVTLIAQDFLNTEFASLPNGANAFDEFLWNPATLRYDLFNRRQNPALRSPIGDVEPYHKDEVTAAIEWQPGTSWAFEARAIAWQVDAPFSATDQFDGRGGIFRLLTNFAEAERDYRGLQIEANRAFRDGLAVRANYTLSRVRGNFESVPDDFLEGMAAVDRATGLPVSAVNRHGRLGHDRTHVLNLTGAKSWRLGGDHSFTVGGWLAFRSGQPWNLQESVALRLPGATATILSTRYSEPRGRRELPDTYTLNLTAAWNLPLWWRASGILRVEVANVTDEQEQIAVGRDTGLPIATPQSYQTPREVRFVAGVRF